MSDNPIVENARRRHEYKDSFRRVFGVPLSTFWEGNILGFDLVKFDEEFVKPGKRQSTEQAVRKKYGDEGVAIVKGLIGAP